jgi:hypothetical protein
MMEGQNGECMEEEGGWGQKGEKEEGGSCFTKYAVMSASFSIGKVSTFATLSTGDVVNFVIV